MGIQEKKKNTIFFPFHRRNRVVPLCMFRDELLVRSPDREHIALANRGRQVNDRITSEMATRDRRGQSARAERLEMESSITAHHCFEILRLRCENQVYGLMVVVECVSNRDTGI